MNPEDRLSQLLHDDADAYVPTEGLARIHDKANARHRARNIRRAAAPVVALCAIAAVVTTLLLRDTHTRRQPVTSVGPGTSTTMPSPSTTAPTPTTAPPALTRLTEASFLSINELPAGPYWGGRWAQAYPIVDPRRPTSSQRAGSGSFLCQRRLVADQSAVDVRARSYFSAQDNPDGRQFDEYLELSTSEANAKTAMATIEAWLRDCRGLDGASRQSTFVRARSLPTLYDGAALYEHVPPAGSGDPLPRVVGLGRVGRAVVVFEVSTQGPPTVGPIDPVERTLRAALARLARAAPASPSGNTAASPTTTAPSASPGTPPCNPGDGSGIRPAAIFFGCGTSADTLDPITWTSWTPTGATGTGTHNVNGCQPNCAEGTYTRFPVEIRLSNPGYLDGRLVFRTVTATPTTGTGTTESSTATGPYGAWGWVS